MLKLKVQLRNEHNQMAAFLVNESNAWCTLSKYKEVTNERGHGVVQTYCGCPSFSGHVARCTVITFFFRFCYLALFKLLVSLLLPFFALSECHTCHKSVIMQPKLQAVTEVFWNTDWSAMESHMFSPHGTQHMERNFFLTCTVVHPNSVLKGILWGRK